MSKIAVLYAYYQTPESEKRIRFFLENGLKTTNTDYYFLLNSPVRILEKIKRKHNNVHIRYYPNANNAWIKWEQLIEEIQNKYTYYIFVKDAMIGPVMPKENTDTDWTNILTSLLNNEQNVGGIVFNPFVKNKKCIPHLQINLWFTDNNGLLLLIKHKLFEEQKIGRNYVVKREYILMNILKNKKKRPICYFKPFRNIKINKIHKKFPKITIPDTKKIINTEKDIWNIHPTHLMFVKYKNHYVNLQHNKIKIDDIPMNHN